MQRGGETCATTTNQHVVFARPVCGHRQGCLEAWRHLSDAARRPPTSEHAIGYPRQLCSMQLPAQACPVDAEAPRAARVGADTVEGGTCSGCLYLRRRDGQLLCRRKALVGTFKTTNYAPRPELPPSVVGDDGEPPPGNVAHAQHRAAEACRLLCAGDRNASRGAGSVWHQLLVTSTLLALGLSMAFSMCSFSLSPLFSLCSPRRCLTASLLPYIATAHAGCLQQNP